MGKENSELTVEKMKEFVEYYKTFPLIKKLRISNLIAFIYCYLTTFSQKHKNVKKKQRKCCYWISESKNGK